MVCHDGAMHPWDRDLKRRIWVLKLPPTDVLKSTDQNDTDIHPYPAVKKETGATQEICAVRACVRTIHSALDEGFREHFCSDPFQRIVWRAGNVVEDQDGPGWTIQADPVHDVSLAPAGHRADAGVPVGPQVLLRGDGRMLGQRIENLLVRLRVKSFDVMEVGAELLWNRHLRLLHLEVLKYCGVCYTADCSCFDENLQPLDSEAVKYSR